MSCANSRFQKQSEFCKLVFKEDINEEIFRLDFVWPAAAQSEFAPPRAGQFFMIKPRRSSVFLGRPISMAMWEGGSCTLKFLITKRGRGTQELAAMQIQEEAELTGPLGNTWADFLPAAEKGGKPVALVGGGVGIAPLLALLGEMPERDFIFYAGFRTGAGIKNKLPSLDILAAEKVIVAAEDGMGALKGRITDFLEPEKYSAVCACGPQPMLKTATAKCADKKVPCFISMERHMGCGTGACLGCTVETINGNRRCCADGPVFDAGEIIFDETD
ncbi:MAG: dihydroorotate dehydrogenase electron transfer subunit [Treponema sp.]|nr:dihydroorotate dehydrogenase electron transfer subunit [Treponema sp.]